MKKTIRFRKRKIGKLLIKFSLLCVISMLVASLYNIVDQIYIGHISEVDSLTGKQLVFYVMEILMLFIHLY